LQSRQRELEMYFQSFEQSAFGTDEMKNFLNAFTELHKLGYEIKPEIPRLLPFKNSDSLYTAVIRVPTSSGFILPHRMVVIRLSNGNLVVYCPVPIDDALHYEMILLGKVSYIIIPNKLHYAFLSDYIARFPDVTVYVPPGLKVTIDVLDKARVLHNHSDTTWQDELEIILTVGNSYFTEVLLYHKNSRVLIVADFLINLPASIFAVENQINSSPEATVYSLITTQLFPTSSDDDKPKCSEEHRKYCVDAKEFSTLLQRILLMDFDYIIMCYGDIIESSAKHVLKDACETVLKDVQERWSVTNSFFSFVGSNK